MLTAFIIFVSYAGSKGLKMGTSGVEDFVLQERNYAYENRNQLVHRTGGWFLATAGVFLIGICAFAGYVGEADFGMAVLLLLVSLLGVPLILYRECVLIDKASRQVTHTVSFGPFYQSIEEFPFGEEPRLVMRSKRVQAARGGGSHTVYSAHFIVEGQEPIILDGSTELSEARLIAKEYSEFFDLPVEDNLP